MICLPCGRDEPIYQVYEREPVTLEILRSLELCEECLGWLMDRSRITFCHIIREKVNMFE